MSENGLPETEPDTQAQNNLYQASEPAPETKENLALQPASQQTAPVINTVTFWTNKQVSLSPEEINWNYTHPNQYTNMQTRGGDYIPLKDGSASVWISSEVWNQYNTFGANTSQGNYSGVGAGAPPTVDPSLTGPTFDDGGGNPTTTPPPEQPIDPALISDVGAPMQIVAGSNNVTEDNPNPTPIALTDTDLISDVGAPMQIVPGTNNATPSNPNPTPIALSEVNDDTAPMQIVPGSNNATPENPNPTPIALTDTGLISDVGAPMQIIPGSNNVTEDNPIPKPIPLYAETDSGLPTDTPLYVKDERGNYVPNPELTVTLMDGKSLFINDWNKLDEKYQAVGIREGYQAMAKAIEADREAFKQNNIRLGDGNYISREAWSKLNDEYKDIAYVEGFDSLMKVMQADAERDQTEILEKLADYQKGENYDIVSFLRDGGSEATLRKAGFKEEDIQASKAEAAKPESQENFVERYFAKNGVEYNPTRKQLDGEGMAQYQMRLIEQSRMMSEATAAYVEKYGKESLLLTGAARVGEVIGAPIARALRPEVGLNDITREEWIITGVIMATAAVPAVRGVAAGVRAGQSVGKAAGKVALAEVRAPIDFIKNPVGGLKSLGDVAETAIRPGKLPIEALEIRTTTVRVPVAETGLPGQQAKILRDSATTSVIKGNGTQTAIRDTTLDLTPTALNKTGPAAVHSTPDIRPFLEGAEIKAKYKPGTNELMAKSEQGLFVAPSVMTDRTISGAFGAMPEGGIKGALIFRDEKIINALQDTNKIYKGTTEIEQKLMTGYKLPKPSQVLISRDMSGDKITLLVFGKPFSQGEIAKMKILGAADTVKSIFQPTYKLSKEAGIAGKVDDLARAGKETKAIEANLAKARKAKNTELVQKLETDLKASKSRAERMYRDYSRNYTSGRIAPLVIYTGEKSMIRSRAEITRENPELARTAEKVTQPTGRIYARPEKVDVTGKSGPLVRGGSKLSSSVMPETYGTSETTQSTDPARVIPSEPTRPIEPQRPGTEPVRPVDPAIPPNEPFRPDEPTYPDVPRTPDPPRPPDEPWTPKTPGTPRPPEPPRQPDVPHFGTGKQPPPTEFVIPREAGETKKTDWEPGTITWRQGSLTLEGRKQDVWHVIPPPYNKKYILTGEYPKGAKYVEGRTPKETIQVIGGKARDNVKVNLGAFEAVTLANSEDITFKQSEKKSSIKKLFSSDSESSDLLRSPGRKHPTRKGMRKPPLHAESMGKVKFIPGVGYTRRSSIRGRFV